MNDLKIVIKDDTNEASYDLLEVPLTRAIIDGKTDVTDLAGNKFTYLTYSGKQQITHTWAYMTATEFRELKGFERRQYEGDFKRPLLTIPALNIADMPVALTVSDQNIINACGVVSDVTATFSETIQASVGTS